MKINNYIWDITLKMVNKMYNPKKRGSIEAYTLMVYNYILTDYNENPNKYTEYEKQIRKEKLEKINNEN